MIVRKGSIRCFSLGLVFSILFTNTIGAYQPEVNFWEERKKNRVQTASLPKVRSLPSQYTNLPPPFLPSSHMKNWGSQPSLVNSPLFLSSIQSFGRIQHVVNPTDSLSLNPKVIFHIQDIHQNKEAQLNISKTIQSLMKEEKTGLVALEGAFGPLPLNRFRSFEDPDSMRKAARYLFKEKKISGAILAGLSHPAAIPPFVGVDDQTLYQANINSYKEAVGSRSTLRAVLQVTKKKLIKRKNIVLNPGLKKFDSIVQAYRYKKMSLVEYLNQYSPSSFKKDTEVERFVDALKMESSMDFPAVERERDSLIEKLVSRLSPDETQQFSGQLVSLKAGRLSYADFYSEFMKLCLSKKIEVSHFRHLTSYIEYVSLSDTLDADRLFGEIQELENSNYERLSETAAERELIQESRKIYLTEKLLDFSLTKEEWGEYQKVRGPQSVVRSKKINLSNYGLRATHRGLLQSFESFYLYAEARDQAIANDLLKQLDNSKVNTAVLVTGGFHTRRITEFLKEAGISSVVFVPHISRVDTEEGTRYLSFFTQQKTPLERLLKGSKLFVALPQLTPELGVELAVDTGILHKGRQDRVSPPGLGQNILDQFEPNSGLSLVLSSLRDEGEVEAVLENKSHRRVVYRGKVKNNDIEKIGVQSHTLDLAPLLSIQMLVVLIPAIFVAIFYETPMILVWAGAASLVYWLWHEVGHVLSYLSLGEPFEWEPWINFGGGGLVRGPYGWRIHGVTVFWNVYLMAITSLVIGSLPPSWGINVWIFPLTTIGMTLTLFVPWGALLRFLPFSHLIPDSDMDRILKQNRLYQVEKVINHHFKPNSPLGLTEIELEQELVKFSRAGVSNPRNVDIARDITASLVDVDREKPFTPPSSPISETKTVNWEEVQLGGINISAFGDVNLKWKTDPVTGSLYLDQGFFDAGGGAANSSRFVTNQGIPFGLVTIGGIGPIGKIQERKLINQNLNLVKVGTLLDGQPFDTVPFIIHQVDGRSLKPMVVSGENLTQDFMENQFLAAVIEMMDKASNMQWLTLTIGGVIPFENMPWLLKRITEEAHKRDIQLLYDFKINQPRNPDTDDIKKEDLEAILNISRKTPTDILAPNHVELEYILGLLEIEDAPALIKKYGLKGVFVKKEENGNSLYLADEREFHEEGLAVEVNNPTAAGDVSNGRFIMSMVEDPSESDEKWSQAIKEANQAGALTTTLPGSQVPTSKQTYQFQSAAGDILEPLNVQGKFKKWFGQTIGPFVYFLFVSVWERVVFSGVLFGVPEQYLWRLSLLEGMGWFLGLNVVAFLFLHVFIRWLMWRKIYKWEGRKAEFKKEFVVQLPPHDGKPIRTFLKGLFLSRFMGSILFGFAFSVLASHPYKALFLAIGVQYAWELFQRWRSQKPRSFLSSVASDPRDDLVGLTPIQKLNKALELIDASLESQSDLKPLMVSARNGTTQEKADLIQRWMLPQATELAPQEKIDQLIPRDYIPGRFQLSKTPHGEYIHNIVWTDDEMDRQIKFLTQQGFIVNGQVDKVKEKARELYYLIENMAVSNDDRMLMETMAVPSRTYLATQVVKLLVFGDPLKEDYNPYKEKNDWLNQAALAVLKMIKVKYGDRLSLDLTLRLTLRDYILKRKEIQRLTPDVVEGLAEELWEMANKKKMAIDASERYEEWVIKAEQPITLAVIYDDNGEAVFRSSWIQDQMRRNPNLSFVFIPREEPIQNDASYQDLRGILADDHFKDLRQYEDQGRLKILSHGVKGSGINLNWISEEVADVLISADCVLNFGQTTIEMTNGLMKRQWAMATVYDETFGAVMGLHGKDTDPDKIGEMIFAYIPTGVKFYGDYWRRRDRRLYYGKSSLPVAGKTLVETLLRRHQGNNKIRKDIRRVSLKEVEETDILAPFELSEKMPSSLPWVVNLTLYLSFVALWERSFFTGALFGIPKEALLMLPAMDLLVLFFGFHGALFLMMHIFVRWLKWRNTEQWRGLWGEILREFGISSSVSLASVLRSRFSMSTLYGLIYLFFPGPGYVAFTVSLGVHFIRDFTPKIKERASIYFSQLIKSRFSRTGISHFQNLFPPLNLDIGRLDQLLMVSPHSQSPSGSAGFRMMNFSVWDHFFASFVLGLSVYVLYEIIQQTPQALFEASYGNSLYWFEVLSLSYLALDFLFVTIILFIGILGSGIRQREDIKDAIPIEPWVKGVINRWAKQNNARMLWDQEPVGWGMLAETDPDQRTVMIKKRVMRNKVLSRILLPLVLYREKERLLPRSSLLAYLLRPFTFFFAYIQFSQLRQPVKLGALDIKRRKKNLLRLRLEFENRASRKITEMGALEGISAIFGLSEPNDAKRHEMSLDILDIIFSSFDDALPDPREVMIGQIVEELKKTSFHSTGTHRYAPLALALMNQYQNRNLLDQEAIYESIESEATGLRKKGLKLIRLIIQDEDGKWSWNWGLRCYTWLAQGLTMTPFLRSSLLYSNPYGVRRDYLPHYKPNLTMGNLSHPDSIRWLDVGVGPKEDGVSFRIIKQTLEHSHPELAAKLQLEGTDNVFPIYSYDPITGEIQRSRYATTSGENDRDSVFSVDGVELFDASKRDHDVTGSRFDHGKFSHISLVMSLHHFGPLDHRAERPLGGNVQWVNQGGQTINPVYKLTNQQHETIWRLMGHLQEGGILYLNMTEGHYPRGWGMISGNNADSDMFLVIRREGENQYRLFDQGIPFPPGLSPFRSTEYLMDGSSGKIYENPGIKALYPYVPRQFYRRVDEWLKVADMLVFRTQRLDKSVWLGVEKAARAVNERKSLVDIFAAYLEDVPQEEEELKEKILTGVRELQMDSRTTRRWGRSIARATVTTGALIFFAWILDLWLGSSGTGTSLAFVPVFLMSPLESLISLRKGNVLLIDRTYKGELETDINLMNKYVEKGGHLFVVPQELDQYEFLMSLKSRFKRQYASLTVVHPNVGAFKGSVVNAGLLAELESIQQFKEVNVIKSNDRVLWDTTGILDQTSPLLSAEEFLLEEVLSYLNALSNRALTTGLLIKQFLAAAKAA
ncbi:hypothetical protein BVX98_00925 [bacterium F11]|nr:hypothetical protein BVX98_00925 [bacterium F11]